MEAKSLFQLLETAASTQQLPTGTHPILRAYPSGDTETASIFTYQELLNAAHRRASWLRSLKTFQSEKIILVHFVEHLDNIIWFWAVLLSGCIPAMSPPLPKDTQQRQKHLAHLTHLLQNPLCITRRSMVSQFVGSHGMRVHAVEDLDVETATSTDSMPRSDSNDLVVLMLTSGSTGNSKAVCLTHGQILSSLKGKTLTVDMQKPAIFFNWIGMDHVAGLLETHLLAILLGAEQVHAQAEDITTEPLKFLGLLSRHRVTRSFAPNFFLTSLIRAMTIRDNPRTQIFNLEHLQRIISGGEPNPIETCRAVSQLFISLGASEHVITPGFGMTETCAGCIYNLECPSSHVDARVEHGSVGHCVPGIQMRAEGDKIANGVDKTALRKLGHAETGRLQLRGPIVFKSYYNDPKSTAEAFTSDGWFDTGDTATIDGAGSLHLVGRSKEIIRVNSITFLPGDIEASLDEANIRGAERQSFVCFSYTPKGADGEQICLIYLPTFGDDDVEVRFKTSESIASLVVLYTGVYPRVLPLDEKWLQKSTLGKLSRGKIKTAFIKGALEDYRKHNDGQLQKYRNTFSGSPQEATESTILGVIQNRLWFDFRTPPAMVNVQTSFFEMGVTSIQLIRFKKDLEKALKISEIPIFTLMMNSNVRALASTVKTIDIEDAYQPVVPLSEYGSQTPLWLFHPGVGEVLVFLTLAKFITDRPVFALRARGFGSREKPFENVEDAIQTYFDAIKKRQPKGPYALAGYSYGAMLAFETAKRLEESGDGQQVKFLASLNLPPHISTRMKQLNWTECLRHLAFFLNLMSDGETEKLLPKLKRRSRREMVDCIIQAASPSRVSELALTPHYLFEWTQIAYALQSMAQSYEPSGSVESIDIFFCDPLAAVASSKQEWLENHLSRWNQFSDTAPRFHEVPGSHYTMLSPENVQDFQRKFQEAMRGRGV